jgi:hypothetical protein
VLAACATATAPCRAEPVVAGEAEPYPYYVEFRVAVNGYYGHSYIVYGRLNASGQPATTTYADIHPTGDMPSMVLGHFIPVHAATMPEKDTLGRQIASRFRHGLTAAEFHRLKLTIAHIRAAGHAWSILAYNCNDFVAEVARGIGMQAPTTLSLPYDFIPALEAINEVRPGAIHRVASARADSRESKLPASFSTNRRDSRQASARREPGRAGRVNNDNHHS